jgi:hypothetical protein
LIERLVFTASNIFKMQANYSNAKSILFQRVFLCTVCHRKEGDYQLEPCGDTRATKQDYLSDRRLPAPDAWGHCKDLTINPGRAPYKSIPDPSSAPSYHWRR